MSNNTRNNRAWSFKELLMTLGSYLVIGFWLCCLIPILLVLVIILPRRQRLISPTIFKLLELVYKGTLDITLLAITVQSTKSIPRKPAIVVANHSSSLDIPLIGALMNGMPHVWFVLAYYSATPVLGYFARKMGIFVDRTSSSSSSRALIAGIKFLTNYPSHALIFPEGGRFTDGTIHDFYSGFALLAQKTKRPVIPVYINNAARAYPPGSFLLHQVPITLVIGPEFLVGTDELLPAFVARVRSWFIEQQKRFTVNNSLESVVINSGTGAGVSDAQKEQEEEEKKGGKTRNPQEKRTRNTSKRE